MAKNETYNQMIHTNRWLMLRKSVLTQHPICQMCEADGRLSASVEVHHIVPCQSAVAKADMEALMFDPHNLMALCHACHVQLHTEMGRSGRQARKQRTKEQLERVKKKFFQ